MVFAWLSGEAGRAGQGQAGPARDTCLALALGWDVMYWYLMPGSCRGGCWIGTATGTFSAIKRHIERTANGHSNYRYLRTLLIHVTSCWALPYMCWTLARGRILFEIVIL